MNDFKRGDLIVFKTHPFNFENSNIKISAFPDYTSPILVIKEVKEKSFEKETGRDNGQQLNCMYYNSRDGKFTEKCISSLFSSGYRYLFGTLFACYLLENGNKDKVVWLNDHINDEEIRNKEIDNYIAKNNLNKEMARHKIEKVSKFILLNNIDKLNIKSNTVYYLN